MILIGQYDSPFVRRVGIALTLYALPFEHRPWSTFGDAASVRRYSPLGRVPVLVLDDGDALIDSHCILDYLDHETGVDGALFPSTGVARRRALNVAALASGVGDKAVSLFYEQRFHESPSQRWMARCHEQIDASLAALETERARHSSAYWFGDHIGHADIAVAVMLHFLGEVHGDLLSAARHPALAAFVIRLNALPAFRAIQQPFNTPV